MCSVIPHVFVCLKKYIYSVTSSMFWCMNCKVIILFQVLCVELQQASVLFFQLVLVSSTVFYNYVLYMCMCFCLTSFMTSLLLYVHSILPIVKSVVGFEVSFSPHI